jgi:hypothetical protein
MIDMKQILVQDHIARLAEEAAALRAERSPNGTFPARTSARLRLGRMVVGVGTLIAGSTRARDNGPCDDGPNVLSPAA